VGTELFDEIDKYVRESGNLTDRFDYRVDWSGLHHWLETNSNPTIAQAYYAKNIEHLFTILDFATHHHLPILVSEADCYRVYALPDAKDDALEGKEIVRSRSGLLRFFVAEAYCRSNTQLSRCRHSGIQEGPATSFPPESQLLFPIAKGLGGS
jgi:hypothetical protein